MPTITIPTAEPFFFPGGKTGCLLVHGFTGTPKEMRWMGEYLAKEGHTVLGVRLTGHATRPEDMIRSRWWDWLASVEDGWNLLKGATDQIYIMGLSMGGILSLLFASRFPVKGLVAMSTPYKLPDDWRLPYLRLISRFMPYMPKDSDDDPPDWHNLEALKDHISYPQNPVRCIAELNDLLAEMRAGLPNINAPALLMHSRDDHYVLPANMTAIFNALGTQNKEMLWIENSGHVITREPQRERVFKAAADFIRKTNLPT